jgi:hypothetical protein
MGHLGGDPPHVGDAGTIRDAKISRQGDQNTLAMPWPLDPGHIDGDKISCKICGKPLSLRHHSTIKKEESYVLCRWCNTRMPIEV